MREKFSLENFRKGQKEAIFHLLNGENVLLNFPTGGGKSLVYQLTTLLLENQICIVISPLIALMKDQVNYLCTKQIPATYYNSTQDDLEQKRILSHCVKNRYKFLYVSPEKAITKQFLTVFVKMNVGLIAIDEAHCISQWGFDFRPEYRKLKILQEIKQVPTLAATATATQRVRKDIIQSLQNQRKFISIQNSYYRKNLHFYVEKFTKDEQKNEKLLYWLKKCDFLNRKYKGIIYCSTRKKVDKVYQLLKLHHFQVEKYHAGLSILQREKIQKSFFKNKNLLVTTNAFGMGIDIPNIRLVLHYNLPFSLESYYQEAGRAGRDNKKSLCILFYSNTDFRIQKLLLRDKNQESKVLLESFFSYLTPQCRQVFICKYFSEEIENCGNCDFCLNLSEEVIEIPQKQKFEFIPENQVKRIFEFIQEENGRIGKMNLVKILRGSKGQTVKNFQNSNYYGILKDYREIEVLNCIEQLIHKKLVLQKNKKFPKLYIPKTNPSLEEKLKDFRLNLSKRFKWKLYMVFSNATLQEILIKKPQDIEQLKNIKGMGEKKIEKFGLQLLKIMN